MKLNHKVRINVADKNGTQRNVLTGTRKHIPYRLLTWLFGEFTEVLVLTPGKSVESVEVRESKGGCTYDQ